MDRVWRLVPTLVLAGPVVAWVFAATWGVAQLQHPHLGWAQAIASDAKAVALGNQLYGDSAREYTGMIYTPLYPMLAAPLYRLAWWDGWLPLITIASGIGLASLVGTVAAAGGSRIERALNGLGVGALAWWLVGLNPEHMLFDGRPDQLAWLFALSGLCALAVGSHGRRWGVPAAVLLLTAAFWTKQTTIGAAVAAVIVTLWWAPQMGRRFFACLAGLNVVLLALFYVVTDGWGPFFLLSLPRRHYVDPDVMSQVAGAGGVLVWPTVVLILAAVGLRGWNPGRSRLGMLATLLLVFALVQLVPSWLAHRKQGGHENQYIGIVWALCLLIAVVHRISSRHGGSVWGAVAYTVAAVVLIGHPVGPGRWHELDPVVVRYAANHLTYLPDYGVIGSQEVWNTQPNLEDLLAAGIQPDNLIEAIRSRHFDAIAPFDESRASYISRSGRTDPRFLAQLNALIRQGYAAGANGAPPPLLGRRSWFPDMRTDPTAAHRRVPPDRARRAHHLAVVHVVMH